jgi:hypothetical protein
VVPEIPHDDRTGFLDGKASGQEQRSMGWSIHLPSCVGNLRKRSASRDFDVQIADFRLRWSRAILFALKGERHSVNGAPFGFFPALRSANDP